MFVGRTHELEALERLYNRSTFQMAVVYGRRRVGKTALLDEFSKDKRTLYFTAQQKSNSINLQSFTQTVLQFYGLPQIEAFSNMGGRASLYSPAGTSWRPHGIRF